MISGYNALMEFSKPRAMLAQVSDKYFVSENERFLYVKYELLQPDRIAYQAGQYLSFKINENGERRSYSIVSTPDSDHGFHILAEILEEGKGSEFLKNLIPGSKVEVLGPLGRFVVADDRPGSKLLFVATGSGIVPIWSMINDRLINRHEKRQMRLHWGMKSEADLFFVDNLARLAKIYPNFVYDLVLSRGGETWSLCRGHVQDCLSKDFPVQGGENLSEWEAYVCGRPDKVISISEKLSELGMKHEHIHHEKFT